MKRGSNSLPRGKIRSITPFLWYDDQAEEAATFYTSLFPNSKVDEVRRAGKRGKAWAVSFTLHGRPYIAFNGGPSIRLTPGFSLQVECSNQAQVDWLWTKLTRGGEESQCGWLVDRFGLSWQIIPTRLFELLNHADPKVAKRAAAAMMKMQRIDLQALEDACA